MGTTNRLPLADRLGVAVALAIFGSTAPAATITVNSFDDDAVAAACNLRSAVASVNAAVATTQCAPQTSGTFGTDDAIEFTGLPDSVVTLAQGQLLVSKATAIHGGGVKIDANYTSNAIYATAALTLSDLTIRNGNSAVFAGGVTVKGSALSLERVTMYGNTGAKGGAAYAVDSPAVTITDSNLSGNYSNTGGGALSGTNSTIIAIGSSFNANGAKGDGGAFYFYLSSVSISTCNLIANNAANGGAVKQKSGVSGDLSVAKSTVAGNTAGSGGAFYVNRNLTLIDSTVSGNSATKNGGAISAYTGPKDRPFTIQNSTLSGNTAQGKGGALFSNKYTSISLKSATISANSASTGGAFYIGDYRGDPGSFWAVNSIVSANSATIGPDFAGVNIVNGLSNVFGAAMDPQAPNSPFYIFNKFTDAPGLGVLADNGGSTRTMALLPGSPALDGGSGTDAPGPNDQRGPGFARVSGGGMDIGAFEFQDNVFENGFEPTP